MNLTTVDRYLDMFPSTSSAKDSDLKAIEMRIVAVSAKAEKYLGRFVEQVERTELFSPDTGLGTELVRLKGYPVSAVDTVSVFGDDYSEADEDFVVNYERGIVQFPERIERLDRNYINSISVKYTGGMAADTAEFISTYPDIESLVLDQVYFELTRVKNIANRSIAGPATTSVLNPYGLLPALSDCLDQYRMRLLP